MMKKLLAIASLTALLTATAGAHCQIPCGIYDDAARIKEMKEHVTTIEKSMKEIISIKPDSPQNNNQLVRWVNNKEAHADKLTEIVTYYFMAQRIKPDAEEYDAKLKTLHAIIIESMKAKQTVELAHVEKLRSLISKFEHLYIGHDAMAHDHAH
jgi:nickel superoxide dismutase